MNRLLVAVLWSSAALSAEPAQPSPTPAASSSSSPPLMEAEAALRAGIHGKCIELSKEALKTGQLDERGTAHAWLVRGRCHALEHDVDRAERSYAVAVRIEPDIILPTEDPIWTRVRPEGTAPATALRLVASAVVMGPADGSADGDMADMAGVVVGIEVALNDDLALGAVVRLEDAAGEEIVSAPIMTTPETPASTTAPAARATTSPTNPGLLVVHRFSGFAVEGVTAVLLDRAGNRLRRVPVTVGEEARQALRRAGATVATATPVREVATLAYVGGAAVALGFVTAAVSGINYAIVSQADETRVLDDELPWLVGFGVGTASVVVGAALVVVERVQGAKGAEGAEGGESVTP